MKLDDESFAARLAGEPGVVLDRTAAGPVLYRRGELITEARAAAAAMAVFGAAVTGSERLTDLGLTRLRLRPGADVLALWAARPRLVRPVHVFSTLLAMDDPDPEETAVRFGAPLLIDEIELARLFAAGPARVLLAPFAGPSVDDEAPLALRGGRRRRTVVVAPAGDQGSERPMYPAALTGVLAVAATDADGRALTPTSGWGDWVDVAEPGPDGTAVAAQRVAAALPRAPRMAEVRGDWARSTGVLRGRRLLRLADGVAALPDRPAPSEDEVLRLAADERRSRGWFADALGTYYDDLAPGRVVAPGAGPPAGIGDRLDLTPDDMDRVMDMIDDDGVPTSGAAPGLGEPSAAERTDPAPGLGEPTAAERSQGEHWLVGTRVLAPDGDPMPRDECLLTATTYAVQIVVGHVPRTGVLETVPAPLEMRAAPPGTAIEMVVQPLGAGLTLPGPATATFTLPAPGDRDGTTGAQVRIRTPGNPGRHRLRCLLYSRGSLLQARLLTVEVRDRPTLLPGALSVEVDFTVATTLDRSYLDGLRPVALSVFVNSTDGGATHDIVYRGGADGPPVTGGISVLAGEVGEHARQVRARLRRVSWGTDQPWTEGMAPRYGAGRPDPARFFADLETLALAGYRLWGALFPQLARLVDEPFPARAEIRALLAAPGTVELSARESLKVSLPATFLYDHPLRESPAAEVCPDFEQAYDERVPLLTHSCFTTGCAYAQDEGFFCPSGFWGLRHQISLIRSVGRPAGERDAAGGVLRGTQRGEAVSVIEVDDIATGIAAATTDPRFTGRLQHLDRLRSLFTDRLTVTERRDEALTLMSAAHDHVVYFFCHGIRTADDYPGLVIGAVNDLPITQSTFGEQVRWRSTRPLVFVNGCETAALEPDSAYTLVGTLVQECGAAGVIGTETTIFEPTATRFAEVFHAAFLLEGQTVGEAVRRARLSLLEEGNPLGLGYTVYAPVSLRLQRRAVRTG